MVVAINLKARLLTERVEQGQAGEGEEGVGGEVMHEGTPFLLSPLVPGAASGDVRMALQSRIPQALR